MHMLTTSTNHQQTFVVDFLVVKSVKGKTPKCEGLTRLIAFQSWGYKKQSSDSSKECPSECYLLLMVEILHHLGCLKPYK